MIWTWYDICFPLFVLCLLSLLLLLLFKRKTTDSMFMIPHIIILVLRAVCCVLDPSHYIIWPPCSIFSKKIACLCFSFLCLFQCPCGCWLVCLFVCFVCLAEKKKEKRQAFRVFLYIYTISTKEVTNTNFTYLWNAQRIFSPIVLSTNRAQYDDARLTS